MLSFIIIHRYFHSSNSLYDHDVVEFFGTGLAVHCANF